MKSFNDEKQLINQLENNIMILEQDFTSLFTKIQRGMNKVYKFHFFS